MKITISTLLLCLIFALNTSAQTNYSVKGSVSDSSAVAHLSNATIMILNAKDSTLRSYTRVTGNGTFAVNKLNAGKFILMVSYPDYADYVEHFSLEEAKPQRDFGKLYLTLKSRLLKDVMIKGTVAAMKIKGDTTEFNAKAYTIQPNSKVEDLLKQLPGISVDKDGKITAQGQTVSKVLVDGEEFFGDDPTLVTKNIRGDMVDKVQLYDKKSDQATFTGIDDGQKTKTINIKLKEDKKNGYFGKLDGGIGTDGYYSGQAMYNRFKGKQKFAIYGIGANTGKTGLGWEDANKYGASDATVMDDGGVIFFGGSSDLDSFDGRYNGQGIPVARTAGVHYDTKYDNDNKTVNTNYKVGSLDITGVANSQNQNTTPKGLNKSNSDQDYTKSVFRQKLDFAYTVKLDTMSTLKFTVDGTAKTSKNKDNYSSTTSNGGDSLLNSNVRSITNDVDNQIFNASVLYNKKLKKKGRTISISVNGNLNNSDAKGYLKSDVKYFDTPVPTDSVTDQYKTTITTSSNINSNFTYTEPVTKKASFIINYGIGNIKNEADRKSFNKAAGLYTELDKRFSNDYTLNQLSNTAGVTYNYRATKSTLNLTARAGNVNYNQTDEYTGNTFKRSFINLNPNASYQYRFSQQRSFRIGYNGYTNQPSIDQIQPILNNNDQINISVGNPNLKPAFRNNFNLSYNSYKILSDQSLWLSGSFNFVNNAIVNSNTYDSSRGKTVYQSVNLTDKTPYNYYVNADVGQKFKFIGASLSLRFYGSGGRSYNFVNGVLNTTDNSNYSTGLSIYKSKTKKYDINFSAGPGYSFGKTSLQPNINNNGYTFEGYGYFNVYLPAKFQFSANGNYDYRGKTQSFNDTYSRVLINSTISKTALKGDNLKFSLSVNDLLNQNQGFDRNANNGNISQNSYTTIKRYFMFSITWDFSQMGGGVPAKK